MPHPSKHRRQTGTRMLPLDGSTEEEMFTAHETRIGANGTLSPSSQDIQELFPRSSSLSPRKHGRKSRPIRVSPPQRSRVLREITSNAPTPRQTKTPWARTKESKAKLSTEKAFVPTGTRAKLDQTPALVDEGAIERCCNVCDHTQRRMHDLEGEVSRLKGEVLVLKAVLRRQGLPMPPSLR